MKFLKAVLPNISIALSLSLLVLVIVDNRHSDRGGAVCRVAAGRALRLTRL